MTYAFCLLSRLSLTSWKKLLWGARTKSTPRRPDSPLTGVGPRPQSLRNRNSHRQAEVRLDLFARRCDVTARVPGLHAGDVIAIDQIRTAQEEAQAKTIHPAVFDGNLEVEPEGLTPLPQIT